MRKFIVITLLIAIGFIMVTVFLFFIQQIFFPRNLIQSDDLKIVDSDIDWQTGETSSTGAVLRD
jgi:hypothetical protein